MNVWNAVKAVNAVKKNNSPHFTAFFSKIHHEIHRISNKISPHLLSNVYSIWFKFSWNINKVRDSWSSGISSWRHAGGQRFEPLWGRFIFVRILRTRWKKINRDSRHSPQKDVTNTQWKFFFTEVLMKIHRQTSTRDGICPNWRKK